MGETDKQQDKQVKYADGGKKTGEEEKEGEGEGHLEKVVRKGPSGKEAFE